MPKKWWADVHVSEEELEQDNAPFIALLKSMAPNDCRPETVEVTTYHATPVGDGVFRVRVIGTAEPTSTPNSIARKE